MKNKEVKPKRCQTNNCQKKNGGKNQLDMDRQEHILQMELMDVLTEISMPDNSDEEGEVHVA